jgi:hypothetical protein
MICEKFIALGHKVYGRKLISGKIEICHCEGGHDFDGAKK